MSARPDKERRKVQISGKSSCMVALPKKWVKDMGLQQGSEVTITRPTANTLMVTAQVETGYGSSREVVIDVEDDETSEATFRKIVSLYVLGYSQITVEGERGVLSPVKKSAVKEMVRRHLIGTEGVAESRERMTVHVLLGYSELGVESALKKMLLIINSMRKDASSALESQDAVLATALREREDEVRRFGLYVIRLLNMSLSQGVSTGMKMEQRDALGYITVARALERIAAHVGNLSRGVTDLDKPLPKSVSSKLVSANEVACELVDGALLSLFKRDHGEADDVIDKAGAFLDRVGETLRGLNGSDSKTYYVVHAIIDSQARIAELATDIAETVLDLTVERIVKEQEHAVPLPQM